MLKPVAGFAGYNSELRDLAEVIISRVSQIGNQSVSKHYILYDMTFISRSSVAMNNVARKIFFKAGHFGAEYHSICLYR